MKSERRSYATKAKFRHAVDCAREIPGFEIGGIEFAPDGTIRVLSTKLAPQPLPTAGNDFDEWERGRKQ